jgi:hypothetical protein
LVRKAEDQLQRLRKDGKRSRLQNGAKLPGAVVVKQAGRRMGTLGNQARAHRRILKVQEFLLQHPDCQKLTRKQLVDRLNGAGIKNITNERTGVSKDWTVPALDPVRRNAMARIAMDNLPMNDALVI